MPTSRPKPTSSLVEDILSYHEDINDLAEEMRNWAEGMEGTNLENSEKYNLVSEAADTLEEAYSSLDEACTSLKSELEGQCPDRLKDTIGYTERRMYKGYQMPRWVRLYNAKSALQGMVDHLRIVADFPDDFSLLDDVESALSDVEMVEFPSMYG